jgi:hypothetical protein
LILNGEMLERSIRHSWKLIPVALTSGYGDDYQDVPTSTAYGSYTANLRRINLLSCVLESSRSTPRDGV